MCKDPAFLFYSSDFLTGTYSMTFEQRGKYITLMCLQHQKGHLTEKDINKICGGLDEDIIDKFIQDGEGKYFNERLEEEIQKRKRYSESRRNNRQGSGKKQPEEPPLKPETMDWTVGFEDFYGDYPRKIARQHALKAYIKALKEGAKPEEIRSGLNRYKQYISAQKVETTYIKHPATWLNSKGWLDEYESRPKVDFY